jgi:hypothetical protein
MQRVCNPLMNAFIGQNGQERDAEQRDAPRTNFFTPLMRERHFSTLFFLDTTS